MRAISVGHMTKEELEKHIEAKVSHLRWWQRVPHYDNSELIEEIEELRKQLSNLNN